MLPEAVATSRLSALQVGALAISKEMVSRIAAVPGGVGTDMVH